MNSADPITRLNAALEGRYRIERELALVHDPGSRPRTPSQNGQSLNLVTVGPAELGHGVENLARQLSLNVLPGE